MKKYLFLGIFLLLISFLSACSSENLKISESSDSKENTGEFRRPDFGQPEEVADIRGLVESIIGNEVTILKIGRPQIGENRVEDTENKNLEDEEKAAAFGSSGTRTRIPGMGGGMRSSGANADADAQAEMIKRMKEMANGETTVLIPVGIRMLKPDADSEASRPEMLEASLEDIKPDKMLQIWLDDSVSDRQIAKFVLITR